MRNVLITMLFAVLLGSCFSNNKELNNPVCDHVHPEFDTMFFGAFNFNLNNHLTGTRLPEIINIVEPDSIPLTSLGNKNLLVLRYSDIHCNTCIDEEVESLQKVFEGKLEHVIILCSYNSERDFIAFRRLNRLRLQAYRIPHNAFDWVPEKTDKPYYFMVNPDNKVSNFYVPNRSYPNLTNNYLQSIRKLLAD